jgi:hypothetical protein
MAKDLYHESVRNALIKDGWTITHDPFRLYDKDRNMSYEVDLGAEKAFAAEKGTEKIVVEIKSFLKTSLPNEFHGILGQYITYSDALLFLEFDRNLILAIPQYAYVRLQEYPFLLHLIEKHKMKTLVYDEIEQIIVSWKI